MLTASSAMSCPLVYDLVICSSSVPVLPKFLFLMPPINLWGRTKIYYGSCEQICSCLVHNSDQLLHQSKSIMSRLLLDWIARPKKILVFQVNDDRSVGREKSFSMKKSML